MIENRKSISKANTMMKGFKSISDEMDGVRNAIEAGIVDYQTIATLKKLLTPKSSSTSSALGSKMTKPALLTNSRGKKSKKTTFGASSASKSSAEFPSTELVIATKMIVMKSLNILSSEVDTKSKDTETASSIKARAQPVSQTLRNVSTCCKLALESLRQWQDHEEIGSAWVNKAYFGYINKLVTLSMVMVLVAFS